MGEVLKIESDEVARLAAQLAQAKGVSVEEAVEQALRRAHLDVRRTLAEPDSDRLNERFGRNAVTLGALTGGRADHVGTRSAFGRIPERAEFHE